MADESTTKTVIIYRTPTGKEPFTDWLNSLRDPKTRRRILRRLLRVAQGIYGDYKSVGDGVLELRFFFGSGYRVYFGEDGDTLVILLTGGDKDSQSRDIKRAQRYWKEYLEND
jgi:putative addiction module killer protein